MKKKTLKYAVCASLLAFVFCSTALPVLARNKSDEALGKSRVEKEANARLEEVAEMAAIPPAEKEPASLPQKDIGLYQEPEMAAIPAK